MGCTFEACDLKWGKTDACFNLMAMFFKKSAHLLKFKHYKTIFLHICRCSSQRHKMKNASYVYNAYCGYNNCLFDVRGHCNFGQFINLRTYKKCHVFQVHMQYFQRLEVTWRLIASRLLWMCKACQINKSSWLMRVPNILFCSKYLSATRFLLSSCVLKRQGLLNFHLLNLSNFLIVNSKFPTLKLRCCYFIIQL